MNAPVEIKYEHWYAKLINKYLMPISALAVGNTILTVKSEAETPFHVIIHELEHVWQYRRDGFLKFNWNYLSDYVKGLIKYRNHFKAYWHIRYEVEARKVQNEYRRRQIRALPIH